eukprot:m51a1_g1360 hypothetical protein (418) ;mRNA; f:389513-391104
MKTLSLLALAFAVACASPLARIAQIDYNRESDLCALYQQLHAMGVPDDHIVVMISDVVANSKSNPKPGTLFNQPQGPNVYPGVPKDYTGRLITPANFVSILTGGAPAGGSGKKLASTSKDTVFFHFGGSGAYKILWFPKQQSMSSDDLIKAINTMAQRNMFKQLIISMDVSSSGSHFYTANLPARTYVTTATSPSELSYRWMPSNELGAFLSDVYSWTMLDYMRQPGAMRHTLQEQFNETREDLASWTPSCQYGDLSLTSQTLGDVFGVSNASAARWAAPSRAAAVDEASAGLFTAMLRHQRHPTQESLRELNAELTVRSRLDGLFARIVRGSGVLEAEVEKVATVGNPSCSVGLSREADQCLVAAIDTFVGTCSRQHSYVDSLLHRFGSVCEVAAQHGSVSEMLSAIKHECYEFAF